MKKVFVFAIALMVIGSVACAGTWDPAYVWLSGQTQQFPGQRTLLNYWGLGLEGGSNWGVQPPTNQDQQWIADRYGNNGPTAGAEQDIMLSSGKIKWRTDTGVPAGGHTRDYTGALGITLGLKVGGSPSSGYPAVYLRGSGGGIQIGYSAAEVSILGVASNWKANKSTTVIDGITGDWVTPLDTWARILVVFNNDANKTFDVWLNNSSNHMWGHATGDAGNYVQFGYLGGASNQWAAYDEVAFGFGSAYIGGFVPEPGSMLALGAGLIGLLGAVRRRR